MTWREPTHHTTDCYFYLVNTKGIGKKNRHKISYPSISSGIRPICTLMSCQSQFLKDFFHLKMWVVTKSKRLLMKLKKYFQNLAILLMRPHSQTPQQFSQPELNDLVCDLGLSKNAVEVLASRLQEKNQLIHITKESYYRNREQAFVPFFTEENKFVYCHIISGLPRN